MSQLYELVARDIEGANGKGALAELQAQLQAQDV